MVSDDDDDEYEECTTSDDMILGTIYDSITAEERHPILKPNLINVQSIRSRFANILYLETSNLEETGHAKIVESLEGHRLHVGDQSATLPQPPTRPTPPSAKGREARIWQIQAGPRTLQHLKTLGPRRYSGTQGDISKRAY